MVFIPPARWRFAILAYGVGGWLLGLFNTPLRALATRQGWRPGVGTMIDVNVFMPLLAAALAVVYPRVWTALLGALLATISFQLGLGMVRAPNVFRWPLWGTLYAIEPIMVAACIGYAMVGAVMVVLVSPWRTVGIADAALRCKSCGYLLIGLKQARCPECGAAFDASSISTIESVPQGR